MLALQSTPGTSVGIRRWLFRLMVCTIALCVLSLPITADAFTGDPVNGTRVPVQGIDGTLVIVGGGRMPDTVYEAFIEAAGGRENANIVVIPTASERADRDDAADTYLQRWRDLGVETLSLLHTRDRAAADDASFVEVLHEATGVWFSGGVQSRLVDAYHDTSVHEALREVLRRGGVVGGTSAGAAIMSDPMIAGGNPEPRLSKGLGFLQGIIIDKHALARERLPRLRAAVDQMPGYFGLAIDEGTAIVVTGRRARVIGDSSAVVMLPAGAGRAQHERTLRTGTTIDLVTYSRAAVERLGDTFPPALTTPPTLENGTLLLGGGGGMPREAMRRFVETSGGPDALIVVIPTALGSTSPNAGATDTRLLRGGGARNVVVLPALTPEDADRPEMLDALREAGGVWFSGGRQWRLMDAFDGTEAAQLMHEVLQRGGAIGGSSAGASIQPEYMVRGHPLGNTVMMAEGYERGLGFLPGAAVDQHFSQRNRHRDLLAVKQRHPQLLCIGIDEGTAILITGQDLEVIGAHRVFIYDRDPATLTEDDTPYVTLEEGERYELLERRPIMTTPSN